MENIWENIKSAGIYVKDKIVTGYSFFKENLNPFNVVRYAYKKAADTAIGIKEYFFPTEKKKAPSLIVETPAEGKKTDVKLKPIVVKFRGISDPTETYSVDLSEYLKVTNSADEGRLVWVELKEDQSLITQYGVNSHGKKAGFSQVGQNPEFKYVDPENYTVGQIVGKDYENLSRNQKDVLKYVGRNNHNNQGVLISN